MNIGIDARLYGPKHTGIGRYTQNLLQNLLPLDSKNQYVIFGNPATLLPLARFPNVHLIKLNTKIYSIAEQAINPLIFSRHKLDLLHVPHFNAPILYNSPLVITLHDLIKHFSTGSNTTTLPAWQYKAKLAGYKLVINKVLKKASVIITPSFYWKNFLIQELGVPESKIEVTYEAASSSLKIPSKKDPAILKKYTLRKPFIIYTGNLYPHKNVDRLLAAVKSFNKNHQTKITLAIISGRSAFQKKILASQYIKPLGFVPDQDLTQLYSQALCLVQPSLIEGFGLTGLEAMQLGLPVLSSSATCLPEIYGSSALYFDPYSTKDLSEKLSWIVKDKSLRSRLISKGKKRAAEFSWKKTAHQTLKIYEQVLKQIK